MDEACDVRSGAVDSPLGRIEIAGCERGLHEVRLRGQKTRDAG